MNYKQKPGQTSVQRIAPVLTKTTTEALELRHTLCGCNTKICARTEMLVANISLSKGATTELADGTFSTLVHASGKLLYQPVNACGVAPYPYNGGCGNSCKPCPDEDVIFAIFKIYTDEANFTLEAFEATATPIVHNACQDFTNQVLIVLPYKVSSISSRTTSAK